MKTWAVFKSYKINELLSESRAYSDVIMMKFDSPTLSNFIHFYEYGFVIYLFYIFMTANLFFMKFEN